LICLKGKSKQSLIKGPGHSCSLKSSHRNVFTGFTISIIMSILAMLLTVEAKTPLIKKFAKTLNRNGACQRGICQKLPITKEPCPKHREVD
jgi:hypothetical protein